MKTFEQRFAEKHAPTAAGCWQWTAGKTSAGYGAFWDGTTMVQAHRWAFEHHVGPIPDGLLVHHTCENRLCVNPMHLRAVTYSFNSRTADTTAARNAVKTHCPKGHAYDEENTRMSRGSRTCKACRNAYRRSLRKNGLMTEVVDTWDQSKTNTEGATS